MTWLNAILIGLDQFAAALIFNRNDCTISALCRVAQLSEAGGEWQWKVDRYLKFARWQVLVLLAIGWALNVTFKNHCEAARLSDLARAAGTIKLLE